MDLGLFSDMVDEGAIQGESLPPSSPNVEICSHGGNVAIRGLNRLSENYGANLSNITLVTAGTPIRPDFRIGQNTNLNAHLNIYSKRDFIQRLGGVIVGFGRRRAAGAIN